MIVAKFNIGELSQTNLHFWKVQKWTTLEGVANTFCSTISWSETPKKQNVLPLISALNVWLSVSWSYRWAEAGCVCTWWAVGPGAPAAGSELYPDGLCDASCLRSCSGGTPAPESGSAVPPVDPGCSIWREGGDRRERGKKEIKYGEGTGAMWGKGE